MMLIFHELLSGVLLYSIFCRATHTSIESTKPDVLFAFWLLGLAAICMLAAPVVANWRPDLVSTILLAGIVAVQVVTAENWREGVPQNFQREANHAHDQRVG